MLTPSARRRCRQETLLLHLRELGRGSEISIQHPETDVDLSALRFRPHASRSHAPGLEQVSMQGLRQTVPKQASSRALTVLADTAPSQAMRVLHLPSRV